MPSLAKILLFCLMPAAVWAANNQVSTDKPIVNFRLPVFNAEGHRAWLVRGSEARQAPENRIAIKDLTLSSFTGKADEKVDTVLLSPEAMVSVTKVSSADSVVVTGPSTIRVINDQFEASGSGWSYTGKDKKVSISKNVRVVFNAAFNDILK